MTRRDAAASRRARLGHLTLSGSFAAVAALLMLLQVEDIRWRSPGVERWLGVSLVLAAWFGLVGWLRFRHGRASAWEPVAKPSLAVSSMPAETEGTRVIHASQTGFARQLAQQTLQSLSAGGLCATSDTFEQLDVRALREMDRVLFVVSTTGEGDPPDSAQRFYREAMRQNADLTGVKFGLLALGDSDYEDFCGFGRELRHWLQASGAQPLFDPVEVDRGDEAALRHWQHHLAMLSGSRDLPDWQAPVYRHWTLLERRQLNPGSVGAACFHLALKPPQGEAHWQAGDLVEIGPCHPTEAVAGWLASNGLEGAVPVLRDGANGTLASLLACSVLPGAGEVDGLDEEAVASVLKRLPHREYSIASVPEDGAIELLVRRMIGADGQPGIGSSWLCEHAAIGAGIALRIRSNPQFHAPADARPLILVGNGTGMAALRGLLKARLARGYHRNWLLFGERQAAHDFHYRDEIEGWHRDGRIERLDLAWSRDQPERIYVQQRLREAGDELSRWVQAGAAIQVCGSLEGMAPGVDQVLRDMLGSALVEQLREQGRYRRDVY